MLFPRVKPRAGVPISRRAGRCFLAAGAAAPELHAIVVLSSTRAETLLQIDDEAFAARSNADRKLTSARSEVVRKTLEMRDAGDSITLSSSEIAAGNQDLSRRTEQAAASLQQTASSMVQLPTTVRQSTESAQQASRLAVSASGVASKGGQGLGQVNQAITPLNQMTQQNSALVEQSSAAIMSLKDQAGRLSEAIGSFKLAG